MRNRTIVNAVAASVGLLALIGGGAWWGVVSSQAPSDRERMLAAIRLSEADVAGVLPEVTHLTGLFPANTENVRSGTGEPDGIIRSSLEPKRCVSVFWPGPVPVREEHAWAEGTVDGRGEAIETRGSTMANRTTAVAAFEALSGRYEKCAEVSYRSMYNDAVATSTFEQVEVGETSLDVPQFRLAQTSSVTVDKTDYRSVADVTFYLIGDTLFMFGVSRDDGVPELDWAAAEQSAFEQRLERIIDGAAQDRKAG